MIRIENVKLNMHVLTKYNGEGRIVDLWISDIKRIYAEVLLSTQKNISIPLDHLVSLDNV